MTSTDQPWHASFPAPKPEFTPEVMPRHRALMILSMRIASMMLIDVRRTDYDGGTIRGSLNIPAQGFYWNRGPLYEILYKADIEWVVFYCGSSNGRGPRCASWFLQHVRETVGDRDMNVMVLEGGVKGWVRAGEEYTRWMDGFRREYWVELWEEEESKKVGEQPEQVVDGRVASAVAEGDVLK